MPTVPQIVTAAPRLNQYLVYLSDTWSVTPNFSAMGSLRYVGQHARTSDEQPVIYGDGAIDPHLALAYTFDRLNGVRVTFDRNSVPPLPLEVQRTCVPASACSNDSGGNANGAVASYPLVPETANDYAFSYEHGGRTQVRLTYFVELEHNVIDVLPTIIATPSMPAKTPTRLAFPPTPATCARMGWSCGCTTADLH